MVWPWGLSGIDPPHSTAAMTRAVRPVPGEPYDWLGTGACITNPGAVWGNPREAASRWLTVDVDACVLRWERDEL